MGAVGMYNAHLSKVGAMTNPRQAFEQYGKEARVA